MWYKHLQKYTACFMLVAILLSFGFLLRFLGVEEIVDKAWIDVYIRNQGLGGWILFVLGAGIVTSLAVPRQVVSFLGGYAFGFWGGSVLTLFGTVLGCFLVFATARIFRAQLAKKYITNEYTTTINTFFQKNTFSATVIIRLLPVGSNFVTNILAGISKARPLAFLTGSCIGFIPQTLIFSLIGSGFQVNTTKHILAGLLLFAISVAWGIWLLQKNKSLSSRP